jgi:hypothetical protein
MNFQGAVVRFCLVVSFGYIGYILAKYGLPIHRRFQEEELFFITLLVIDTLIAILTDPAWLIVAFLIGLASFIGVTLALWRKIRWGYYWGFAQVLWLAKKQEQDRKDISESRWTDWLLAVLDALYERLEGSGVERIGDYNEDSGQAQICPNCRRKITLGEDNSATCAKCGCTVNLLLSSIGGHYLSALLPELSADEKDKILLVKANVCMLTGLVFLMQGNGASAEIELDLAKSYAADIAHQGLREQVTGTTDWLLAEVNGRTRLLGEKLLPDFLLSFGIR